jgi:membrane protein
MGSRLGVIQQWWNSPRASWVRICLRLFRHLAADFTAHGCQKSAAALTYVTLFAIVPLMTVIYAVLSLIPAFGGLAAQLQQFLFSHFVPETGQELQSYLQAFSSQARALTGAGVGILVVTAYLMLTNIEKTFNDIWGVTRARRGLSSFFLYWAVLTIGPMLMGAGLAINTYLLSLKLFFHEHDALGVSPLLFQVLPFLFMASMFTLLFAAVPNCRVPLKYALIGGAVTAALFELLKDLFGALVANSSFQLVYGAFAAVPLFLLWINLVWIVILGGAVLVRTLADRAYVLGESRYADMLAALKCLALLRERNLSGGSISDHDCYRLGVGVVHWQRLRHRLERAKWLVAAVGGRYVLGRDLRGVNLWDLARILEVSVPELEQEVARSPGAPWLDAYLARRSQLLKAGQAAFALSLEALFQPVAAENRGE